MAGPPMFNRVIARRMRIGGGTRLFYGRLVRDQHADADSGRQRSGAYEIWPERGDAAQSTWRILHGRPIRTEPTCDRPRGTAETQW